jgi:hypothetical protein
VHRTRGYGTTPAIRNSREFAQLDLQFQELGTGPRVGFGPTLSAMHESKQKESWPRWSNWALIAVIATTLLTVAVTLNDIF